MPKIRKEITIMSKILTVTTRNHAIITTDHFYNKNLSLKAKGLLTQILANIDLWNGTVKGLAIINKESEYVIREILKELEKAGYCKRKRTRKSNGQYNEVEYTMRVYPVNIADTPLYHHSPHYEYYN